MKLTSSLLLRFASAAALVIAWLALTGGSPVWWIMLLHLLASIAAVEGGRRLLAKKASQRVIVSKVVSVAIGLWLALSAITVTTGPRLEANPQRFAEIRPAQSLTTLTDGWQDLRIGLALSGGGYRAAVLHSGVLQALETYGIKVSNLSTVSGGSIIGAYYAVGGDPKSFTAAVANGYFDLRGQLALFHNAVRLPFPAIDRLDVQAELLDNILFSRAALAGGLSADEPQFGQPELMIVATDLTYGFQVGLLPGGILVRGDLHSYPLMGLVPEEPFTLAQRAAVSGAFPIAFPPRRVVWRSGGESEGHARYSLLLADGGVRDNSGSYMARLANNMSTENGSRLMGVPNWKLDALLVSDGGASLGVARELDGSLELLSRVFDLATIGRETASEMTAMHTLDTCDEPVALPETFAPPAVRPEEGFTRSDGVTWNLRVNLVGYPSEIVREMIAALPREERTAADRLLDRYLSIKRTSGIDDESLRESVHQVQTEGQVSADAADTLLRALDLQSVFHSRLLADLETFRATRTLESRLPESTVEALERLGKLLVYLSWPSMQRVLELAKNCRDEERVLQDDAQLPVAADGASRRR